MSSLKDLASLIMVPSLYKDGELHTVKPLGNSILHPDATGNHDGTDGSTPAEGNFTFSRGSNLAATRVDVNGLIEKGRENLLLQSNQFDTTWTLGNTSVTGGQSGYDGTNNAWRLESTDSARSTISQAIALGANIVNTFSIYAKVGNIDFLKIIIVTSGSNSIVTFDLSDGSATSTNNEIDASAEDVGGDWWRLSLVSAPTANITDARLEIRDSSGSSASAVGSFIYIQDAQLEKSMVATDYIETGASTAQAGILEDMPRLDYSASCPALLLEPQRTNIITNSEYLGASSWVKSGNGTGSTPVIITNDAISPEGIQNATKVDLDINGGTSSGDWSWVYQSFTSTGNDETFSMYIKAADASNVGKIISYGSVSFENHTLTADWVRIDSTSSAAVGGYGNGFRLRGTESTSDTASFYVYGIQHETGSYPTSYIPTYGSSVTRSDDNISDSTFTALPNADFTIFLEVDEWVGSQGNNYQLRFFDASGNRAIQFRNRPEGWRWLILNDEGSGAYLNTGNYTYTKMACRYDGTNYQLFADGSAVGSAFAAMDTAILNYFDSYPIGIMGIKQMVTFPTALTDSECIALTTL